MMLRQLAVHTAGAMIFASAMGVSAQTLSCPPPRPDAPSCSRFHYHVRAWQPATRTPAELSATPGYASREACDAARASAQKASQSFAEQVKSSKIDGSIQADVLGECHCDMTHDPGSRSFLDDEARLRQRRVQQDITWQLREKLLGAAHPAAAQLLQSASPPAHVYDRFLAEKLTVPAAANHVDAKPLVLLDTAVATKSAPPAIAADLTLLKLEPPPAPPPMPAAVRALETPPPAPVAQAFFAYETARLGAVVDASQVLSDQALKNSIRAACEQRRQVLANLELVAHASDRNSRLVRALEQTATEEEHVALLRTLFGAEAAASWAPSDAKDAIMQTKLDPREVATLLAESQDAERRRTAVYFSLARYSALSAAEARTLSDLLNALLPEEGIR